MTTCRVCKAQLKIVDYAAEMVCFCCWNILGLLSDRNDLAKRTYLHQLVAYLAEKVDD